MDKYLVIGGDGLVGRTLVSQLKARGYTVDATSRRSQSDAIQLDLAEPNLNVLCGYSHVFLCAGITNISACEADPVATYKINVDSTATIATHAAKNGAYVYYISSNTVFDGGTPFPDEDCFVSPVTEYGKQKAVIEKFLLKTPNTSVIRITKLISLQVPLFKNFFNDLNSNTVVTPFSDLNLCPMSLSYFCESVQHLMDSKVTGLFHLSGEKDLSYAEFCVNLAKMMGVDECLVQPVSRDGVIYTPQHAGLGMRNTKKMTGLQPEFTQHALKSILAENA